MDQLTTCKVCGGKVAREAPTCPHCGVVTPGREILCPSCGSSSIASKGQKGFGLGRAAVGGLLLGPVGLLGGMVGHKKSEMECRDCGRTFYDE